MAIRRKKEIGLGGFLVLGGCVVRLVRLVGARMGAVDLASARWLYIAMLCLLCGGFALLAYEKKGRASFCALAASVTSLLSTVMGNMSEGDDFLRILSAVFLVLTFAFAGLHAVFAADGNSLKTMCGVAVCLLGAVCALFAFGVNAAPMVTLLVLAAAYLLAGISVCL